MDHGLSEKEIEEYDLTVKIMKKVERQVGYPPIGMLDLLHILSSPELIEDTKKYLEMKTKEDTQKE